MKNDIDFTGAIIVYINIIIAIVIAIMALRLYFRIMKYLNLKIKHLQKKTET